MKKEVILTIKEDISICENYPCANGSYQLLNQLLAKYSVLYKDFNKTINISYKSVPIHGEPDYRPELKLVAEKLKMMLKLDNINELSPTCPAKAKTLFISHRNCDKQFADILADFCALIGIPSNEIFCSSLPGNDVQHKIDDEIKINLQNSKINIILLSKDYFDSVYCLNEEGIIWYLDSQSIPFLLFALPEITEKELKGFIDKNYKIQRIDNESDLMMTFDILKNYYNLTLPIAKINEVVKKTIKQSQSLLAERTISTQEKIKLDKIDFNNLTDDELIVLFYVIENRKIQINLDKINNWMLTSEIYGIDIENA